MRSISHICIRCHNVEIIVVEDGTLDVRDGVHMITVATNQAPSRKLVVEKFEHEPCALDFHLPHRSFRDSVHDVHQWLADVIMSSQARQAISQIVGLPEHKNHRLPSQQALSPQTCTRDSGHLWYGQVHVTLED